MTEAGRVDIEMKAARDYQLSKNYGKRFGERSFSDPLYKFGKKSVFDGKNYPLPYDGMFGETSFSNPGFKDKSWHNTSFNSNLNPNDKFSGFYRINNPHKNQPNNSDMGIPAQGAEYDVPSPERPSGSLMHLPNFTLTEHEDAAGVALKGTEWKYTETGIEKLALHIYKVGDDLFYEPSSVEKNKMTQKQQDNMEQIEAKDGRKIPYSIKLTQDNGKFYAERMLKDNFGAKFIKRIKELLEMIDEVKAQKEINVILEKNQ